LDFGGNVLRHGPVDEIRVPAPRSHGNGQAPAKECPLCQALIAAGYARCPECGHQFPPPERRPHEPRASEASILSSRLTDTQYIVRDIAHHVHRRRDAPPDAPQTMRVDYRLGLNHWQSEFICFEHSGYARQKAVVWWRQRSPDPVPDTAKRAVEIAEGGGLAYTETIIVRHIAGDRYDRIVAYELGPLPEPIEPKVDQLSEQEVPF
jgi:DNA repair protein RadD